MTMQDTVAMVSNSDINPPTLAFNPEADYAIGGILSVFSFLGALSNITSLVYFSSLKARSKNALFFKRLYVIISFNDVFVCLGILPFIEATFSKDRESFLFDFQLFCTTWFAYWWIVSNLSYVLVALLSVTRLRLLGRPTSSIPPWVAYLVPCVLVILYTTVCMVGVPTGLIQTAYIPDLLQCTFSAGHPLDTDNSLNTSHATVFLVLMLLFNSLTANVFILVAISFILSLTRLRKSTRATSLIGGSVKRQREAAKTVIVVTLVYILFNVPGMLVAMAFALNIIVLNPATFQEITLSFEYFGENTWANHYLFPVTGCVCMSE
ncbi:hypothetical protein ACHWQZ_G005392 [Mnemiopsis leidyi]